MYLLFMSTRREHFDGGGDMLLAKKATLMEAKAAPTKNSKNAIRMGRHIRLQGSQAAMVQTS